MPDEERFAGRLRELREKAGLTQKDLATKAGLSLSAVTHFEHGLRVPSWPSVLALAAALGVDCTAFTQEPSDIEPRGKGRPAKEPTKTRRRGK